MTGRRLTTAETAARLGVKPATLYAYVSRGLLERTRTPAGSTFDAVAVERMAASSRRREGPAPLTFVTELTLIEGGSLRYRGEDALLLSRTKSFEEVAEWLWRGEWPENLDPWTSPPELVRVAIAAGSALPPGCPPADRWRVVVAAAATVDPLRHDRAPAAVARVGRALISALVDVLPLAGKWPERQAQAPTSLAARLWPRLSALPATPDQLAVLDAALVLMADHELPASTLAARAAASFGADPYASVLAGLAAASGPLHAASSLEVRPVLARAQSHGPAVAIGEVLGQGRHIHGFGQPLYPDGDPRATELLTRLRRLPAPMDAIDGVLSLADDRGMPPANVDFALAALAQTTMMIPGASEAIFLLGRTAGWLAHAAEEYTRRTSFRVRATYVGRR